jgi:hypothetical protein
LAASCATPDEAELRVKVFDVGQNLSLAGAVIAIERGGIYVTNPDPSRGNPSYVWGARASDQGTLGIRLPTGPIGVHAFADGHYYGAHELELDQDLGITVNIERFQREEVPPTIAGATLEPSVVTPGQSFTISAEVTQGDSGPPNHASDPLSEEVIVVDPVGLHSRALDPPSAGIQGTGFPDGVWSTTLSAPSEPGTYDYYLTATSEGCVTSDATVLTLEAR